jgi:nucleotide-binding universal stress UspA family protein
MVTSSATAILQEQEERPMTYPGSPEGRPEPRSRHTNLLLVPLDGSSLAEQALPVAATIAHRSGMRVHLVAVLEATSIFLTRLAGGEELLPDPGLEQERREQLTEYLKEIADALGTTHGVEATFALLDGDPARELAEHARVRHAKLMVMTTHGHSGVQRLWLGSVADRLLRRVSVPVLLLRPGNEPRPTEYRHLLVALDGSSEGEGVLEPAMELASLCQESQLTLIQVVEPPIPLITRMAMSPARMRPHWRDLQENAARNYLERVAVRLRAGGHRVSTQMVSERGAAEQIGEHARQLHADLIVVGTHGARGVERMLLGSVADKVIRGAPSWWSPPARSRGERSSLPLP